MKNFTQMASQSGLDRLDVKPCIYKAHGVLPHQVSILATDHSLQKARWQPSHRDNDLSSWPGLLPRLCVYTMTCDTNKKLFAETVQQKLSGSEAGLLSWDSHVSYRQGVEQKTEGLDRNQGSSA